MSKTYKRYDDEFRASAVLMLEAAGYPNRKGALSQVAAHLGVPLSTLREWFTGAHNPPPAKVRNEKKRDFVIDLQNLLGLHIDAAGRVVEDSGDLRAIVTGIGIIVDKIQLLTGNPTERQEVNVTDHRERVLADIARKAEYLATGEADSAYPQPIA